MSSVNLTGAPQGLYQYLQSVSADNNASSSSNSSNNSSAIQTLSQTLSGAQHHRHHGGGFMQQIQQAVASALQASQNGKTSNPNKVVQNAIAAVLNGGSGSSDSDKDGSESDPTTAAPGATGQSSGTSISSFFQTLQKYGVSPAQFRQDFLSALQNVQGGSANPAAALQNVPSGLAVDTLG